MTEPQTLYHHIHAILVVAQFSLFKVGREWGCIQGDKNLSEPSWKLGNTILFKTLKVYKADLKI